MVRVHVDDILNELGLWKLYDEAHDELDRRHDAIGIPTAPEAPPTAVGDWHDRQRPGVVARVKSYAGMCSLEAHQPGQDRATPGPVAPTLDAVAAIAAWWATRRDQAGPVPSGEQMEAARQQITSRGRR